jgi:hypothetical protein
MSAKEFVSDERYVKELKPETLLEEAQRLVAGPKREEYGELNESMGRIADVWSAILGRRVNANQVALCMAGLKLIRESHEHKRDNLVDAAAYCYIADEVTHSF